ncbi:MAG: hypothetical protein HY505_02885 [Candidatus Yanofskybacteria bacterium]|nr:hypothetical protein [Candidatus Yanofskybacteria bacterium]
MTKILALGEAPHGANLDEIKKNLESRDNLSGIFLEHPVNYQDSINSYLQNKNLDEKIRGFWERCAKGGNDIKDIDMYILDFAFDRKIPVVCIDSSKTQTDEYNKKSNIGYWFLRGESRDEDMFENIIKIYNKNEEWVVLCGATHLTTEIHPRSGLKTLGARLKEKFGENFSYLVLGL